MSTAMAVEWILIDFRSLQPVAVDFQSGCRKKVAVEKTPTQLSEIKTQIMGIIAH